MGARALSLTHGLLHVRKENHPDSECLARKGSALVLRRLPKGPENSKATGSSRVAESGRASGEPHGLATLSVRCACGLKD